MVKLEDIKKDNHFDPFFRIPIGTKISHLTVTEYLGITEKPDPKGWIRKRYWYKCTCDLCGNTESYHVEDNLKYHMKTGDEMSCGCRKHLTGRIKEKKPSRKSTNKYSADTKGAIHFTHITSRCYNPNDRKYSNYGGKGIAMCKEWRDPDGYNHVDNFCDWLYKEAGYSDDMGGEISINRYNNNKGYSPDNCYLSYQTEQTNNTTKNTYITWYGQRYSLAELCREFGKDYNMISRRLDSGRDIHEALFSPKFSNQITRANYITNSPNGLVATPKAFSLIPFQFVDHSELDARHPIRTYDHPNHEQALNVAAYQERIKRTEQLQPAVKPFQFTNVDSTDFLLEERTRNWRFQF